MNIIEQVWNRIYLEFNINEIIQIEKHINSYSFVGYGKLYPYTIILDKIKNNILKKFNKKDIHYFISDETTRVKLKNNFKEYYILDFIFRENIWEGKDETVIINIILNEVSNFIDNNFYINKEIFMNDINTILHSFNKKYIDKIIISINTPVQSENIEYILDIFRKNSYGATKNEYEAALKAYEESNFLTSIIEANKSLESLLKCICYKHSIYIKGDTIGKLVDSLNEANYFSDFSYLIENLNHLSGLFKSGVNNIRNKDAAHGGGITPHDPDKILSKLAIDLTTTYIVFFIQLENKN